MSLVLAPLEERFWKHVSPGDPNECWEWQGYCGRYGQLSNGSRKNPLLAHRVSWEITNGVIPDGLYVLHKCDNPPCCNPNHLFLGTARDNLLDAIAKGRYQPWNKGKERIRCSEGHLFDGRDSRGNQKCSTCRRQWQRRRRAHARSLLAEA